MYQSEWCHNHTDHSMNPFHYENYMSHLRFWKLSVWQSWPIRDSSWEMMSNISETCCLRVLDFNSEQCVW